MASASQLYLSFFPFDSIHPADQPTLHTHTHKYTPTFIFQTFLHPISLWAALFVHPFTPPHPPWWFHTKLLVMHQLWSCKCVCVCSQTCSRLLWMLIGASAGSGRWPTCIITWIFNSLIKQAGATLQREHKQLGRESSSAHAHMHTQTHTKDEHLIQGYSPDFTW